jgi:hypothetical protein
VLSDGKYLIIIVTVMICIKGLIYDVNEIQELMFVKCSVKCCTHISVS